MPARTSPVTTERQVPAIPLPDQGTKQLLDQAYSQARSELKGQAPDSLLQPFQPSPAIPPQGVGLSISTPPAGAEPVSDPSAPPPGAVPYGSDVESTPPPDAEPVTGKPPAFQGFWNELGNQTMKAMAGAGKGLANIGWGAFIQAASALPGDHSKDNDAADAGFKAIADTFDPAIQHWQSNADSNAATTGRGAKITAGVLGGAAPLALGPEAFLGQATMNAGTDSVDANQDIKTAYTLAGINLIANAAGMKVPFKSPNVVKRVLANGAYGATVSAAAEWLTKKFLNDGGYKEAADNIDPTDPTTLATSGLISAIFGYLEKPNIRKGFEERGGTVPGTTPPPAAEPVKSVAAVTPETPAKKSMGTPAEQAEAQVGRPLDIVPDHPTAEPVQDLKAQIADMKDPATARKAVYLASDNVKELGTDGVAELATGAKQIRNFDGKGGILIVPDVETARTARDLKKSEPDMQKVLGQLTGAGDGKAAGDTVVVQGQTPEGAVATEGAVRPDEVPNKVAEVQAEGKTPVVTTAEDALKRRAATVRFYHGGADYAGGPRWLTSDRKYAEGYARKSGGKVFQVDIPEDHPVLAKAGKAFDDTGTSVKAPYNHFDAPEEIAKQLRPVDETAPEARGEAQPETPPEVASPAESVPDSTSEPPVVAEEAPDKNGIRWRYTTDQEGKRVRVGVDADGNVVDQSGTVTRVTYRKKPTAQEAPQATIEPPPATKAPPKSTLEQTMADLAEKEKPAKGRKLVPLKDRMENAASAGAALKAAANEAHGKGVDEKLVDRANAAANEAIRLGSKTEEQIAKGQGTGHSRVTAVVDEMHKAARVLEGRAQPGDEVKVETRAATLKAQVAKRKAEHAAELVVRDKRTIQRTVARPAERARIAEETWAANEAIKQAATPENTITVKPHIIRGRELEALVKETGVDPADIAAQAEKATGSKRGALTGYLQELANGMDVNKGWLPHMSALNPERSKSSPLNRSQHIQLKNLIKRFAISDAQNAEHARDALTNFMQDIGGKRLDDRTQAAVHEYAQARRRMEVLKDKFGEDEDVSPGESVHDEGHESGEEAEHRTFGLDDGYADKLWGSVSRKLDESGFKDYLNRNREHNLHDLLRVASDSMESGPARAIVQNLLRYAPDLPVRFVDQVVSPRTGEAFSRSSGMYARNPHIDQYEIQVKLNGSPSHPLRTLMHEAVHAATMRFMRLNPEHELTKEIGRLHQIAKSRYDRMYNGDDAWLHNEANISRLTYGLTDPYEFLAESLSNPDFQEMLIQSERYATPMDKLRSIVHRMGEVIRRMLGIKEGPEAKLFNNVLDTTGQLMRQQHEMLAARGDDLELHMLEPGERASLRALDDEPPRLRNEEQIMRDKPEAVRTILRAHNYIIKSGAWDKLSKNLLYASQLDQIVRRRARFFGKPDDPANPLRNWMASRETRSSIQGKLLERATDVGQKWMRLTPAQNRRLGQFMDDSTRWGIDPTVDKADHSAKTQAQRGYDARYADFQNRWNNLSPAEQEVYTGARDANKWMTEQSRKAGVNAALRSVDDLITPAERQKLLDVKDPREYDSLIGDDKPIDLSDQNEAIKGALKDLAGLHEMEGPYFHLGREGSKVVQVKPEGTKEFDTREEAQRFADQVHELGPSSTAKVAERGGKHVVDYEAKYVSMHESGNDAEADAARMRALGFDVGPVTEKLLTKETAPLTHGLRELVTEAGRKIESHGKDDGTEAAKQAMTSAFVHLLATRSAYAGSKLARKGFAGVKPEEMRMNFARHATATAWHTANLSTMFDEAEAMAKLRESAREPEIGNGNQRDMYQRGRVVAELNRRAQQLAQNYGVKSPYSTTMAQLNYMKFLFSPAHAGIWLTQNISVGVPTMGAKYGYGRAASALLKSSSFLPALRSTVKGLLSKPGGITHTDVTKAVIEAMRKNPALERWTKGENSPLQQLADRGAISSSLSDELASVGRGDNQTVAKTMEWARLLPHMADLYNRLSTAVAGLELTNGDVTKTADLIREIHVDYSSENQSGLFKDIKRVPVIGPSVAALKTYVQGMTHLMMSNIYDVITGEGKPRAEAAKVLAGLYVGSAIFAGVVGSTPFPARLLAYGYNKIFGDDGEYYSLDNSIRRWLSDHFSESTGRMLAGGVPQALGFDLSGRMGLSDLPFHNAPDLFGPQSYTDKMKDFVFSMAGTLPQMIGESADSFTQHMHRGEPFQAFASVVPVKALNDAQKAYDMAENGRRTKMGATVLGPDKFTGLDATYQALGLKPSKVADIQGRQGTAYEYKNWAEGKKQQLIAAYNTAASPADRAAVQKQIDAWGAKNHGMRVTYSDLRRQAVSNIKAGQLGRGQPGRDPVVNKLLDY